MSDVTEFKRDSYYKALREYGLPHHLVETIVDEFAYACDAMFVGAQIRERLQADNARLTAELASAKETIRVFTRTIVRAEATWKAQHQDSEFYPDVPDLVVWLKEQVDALKERRCETCRYYQYKSGPYGTCGLEQATPDAYGWTPDMGCSRHEPQAPKPKCDNCRQWLPAGFGFGRGFCELRPLDPRTTYCTDTCDKHEDKEGSDA